MDHIDFVLLLIDNNLTKDLELMTKQKDEGQKDLELMTKKNDEFQSRFNNITAERDELKWRLCGQ